MWERFSFYGMQGILLYYLYYSAADGGLGIDQATATSIVGAYGGLVYLSTIGGGWVADRLVGAERVLFWSASVVMLGHIALALVPGTAGVGVGLVLIALGSGGGKATATSLVGTLYAEGDTRPAAAPRGRPLLPGGRPPPRRRLLAVLPGHQRRRPGRPAAHRAGAGPGRLP